MIIKTFKKSGEAEKYLASQGLHVANHTYRRTGQYSEDYDIEDSDLNSKGQIRYITKDSRQTVIIKHT